MKWLSALLGAVVMLASSFAGSLVAQVKATGHVFAEVIESLSANMNTNQSVFVDSGNDMEEFEMGELIISGGALDTYNLIIIADKLTGEPGTPAPFLASTDVGRTTNVFNSHGKQVFRLFGSLLRNVDSNTFLKYTAAYQVTFAYN